MFGYSEQQMALFGLGFGIGAFMLYTQFIGMQLARDSKAGCFAGFVLLLVLGSGLVGFAAKGAIKLVLLYLSR